MAYKKVVPLEKVVPFKQVIPLPTTTSTNSDVVILTVPVYNAVWADFLIEVIYGDIIVTISTDSTYASLTSAITSVPVTVYRLTKLVLGTPENVSTDYGSHTMSIAIRSKVAGEPGQISGRIHVYGYRRG